MNSHEDTPVGDAFHQYDLEMRVKNRIACPELGYPVSEAKYASVKEWEQAHSQSYEDWYDYIDL